MHNILLIAKREYLERVRTKAFIIATLLIPVLLGGIGFGGIYLSQRTQPASPTLPPERWNSGRKSLHARPSGRA